MEFKDILAVPGMPGLYKVVGNNKNGFIVESILDGKRSMVNGQQRIMTLIDIAVYTSGDEKPLREIFLSLQEKTNGKLPVDLKGDDTKIREYFRTIVPDFDEERVYNSDIKKMLNWFQLLNGKVDFTKPVEADAAAVKKEDDKPAVPKVHEAHGPKAEQHAKTSTARTRKKV